jgi:hypothetical protein
MFSASDNQGFQLTFANGNTVSVQFGPGNYCNPEHPLGRGAGHDAPMKAEGAWKSTTAEVAAWNADGDWHNFGSDKVEGWQSTDEVLRFVSFVANNELNTESPFSADWDDDEDDEDNTLVEHE